MPAFSADKAVALIEKELGAPINEIFAIFERQPIAAASLGQVCLELLPHCLRECRGAFFCLWGNHYGDGIASECEVFADCLTFA